MDFAQRKESAAHRRSSGQRSLFLYGLGERQAGAKKQRESRAQSHRSQPKPGFRQGSIHIYKSTTGHMALARYDGLQALTGVDKKRDTNIVPEPGVNSFYDLRRLAEEPKELFCRIDEWPAP
jgi:hypothetical protein